jgi:hypothetical protein
MKTRERATEFFIKYSSGTLAENIIWQRAKCWGMNANIKLQSAHLSQIEADKRRLKMRFFSLCVYASINLARS